MTLPKDFEAYTRQLMGEALYGSLEQGLKQEPPTSIRFNPFKTATVPAALNEDCRPVTWCPEGCYLPFRPNFTFDPLFHAGLYYVQEASSMFISHILRQLIHEPVMMLDLCAAPGGKTTTARAVLPEGSVLFTNEPMKLRASILAENVQKFGHPDVVVTNNYAADYQRSGLLFDIILTDVPCSGEGMFRKDEGALAEWSRENVEKCWQLQRTIVADIWPCLRAGGLLIYATCTFNAHEDEENVNWIAENLGADFVEVETKPGWNITGALIDSHPVYRFIPGKTEGEGLFVAVLRKLGDSEAVLKHTDAAATGSKKRKRPNKKSNAKPNGQPLQAEAWLEGSYEVVERGEQLTAIPTWWLDRYEQAYDKLHVIHAGVTLGTTKGNDLVPHESLALSIRLKQSQLPNVALDYNQAIAYLRKEAITLSLDAPRGFVLLTYKGHALGFGKNIGNRVNNLYPQEWKIKSTYLPDEPVDIINISSHE